MTMIYIDRKWVVHMGPIMDDVENGLSIHYRMILFMGNPSLASDLDGIWLLKEACHSSWHVSFPIHHWTLSSSWWSCTWCHLTMKSRELLVVIVVHNKWSSAKTICITTTCCTVDTLSMIEKPRYPYVPKKYSKSHDCVPYGKVYSLLVVDSLQYDCSRTGVGTVSINKSNLWELPSFSRWYPLWQVYWGTDLFMIWYFFPS